MTENGIALPGLYVAGWIKRGPSGVIGTNKPDSHETVHAMLEDVPVITPCQVASSDAVLEFLQQRGVRVVTFEDWRRIDQAEIDRGKAKNKPREKFTRVEEMLAVLDTVTTPSS